MDSRGRYKVVEARGWMQSDEDKGVNARGVWNRHEKPPQKCRFPRFVNPICHFCDSSKSEFLFFNIWVAQLVKHR